MRDEHGNLFFRPSGHGALIHNLQELDADIIFIKNIDNVTTQSQVEETVFYKQVLAGLLMELRMEVNQLLDKLDQGGDEVLE